MGSARFDSAPGSVAKGFRFEPSPSPGVPEPPAGWRAELELAFARDHGRTRLAHRWHRGPLRIQRPFYPGQLGAVDPCQVVILHPPGGVVGGDRLGIEVSAEEGAHAQLTTPGATKFYRSAGSVALQRTRIRVAGGATLEWTPQETILFDGSLSRIETRVQLEARARFLGWEITALGRPAAKAPFASGLCRQIFEIERDGVPIWIERGEHRGGGASLAGSWGLAGREALGVMVCAGCDEAALAPVRSRLEGFGGDGRLAAVTKRGDLVILRALAHETRPIFELFASLRRSLLGEDAPGARIWAT